MIDQAVAPTWFMESTQHRQYARPAIPPAAVRRPTLPPSLIRALDKAFSTPRQRLLDSAAARQRRSRLDRILLWTVCPAAAILLWGGAVYDTGRDGPWRRQIAAAMRLEPLAEAPAASSAPDMNVTTIAKTPAGFAQLVFNDVAGPVGVPIPLNLDITSALENEPVAIRITGLPESFYLTSGYRLASGSWMLQPGDAAGVQLVAPVVPSAPLTVSVSAVTPLTGELRAPVEALRVKIEPAAGPPER